MRAGTSTQPYFRPVRVYRDEESITGWNDSGGLADLIYLDLSTLKARGGDGGMF